MGRILTLFIATFLLTAVCIALITRFFPDLAHQEPKNTQPQQLLQLEEKVQRLEQRKPQEAPLPSLQIVSGVWQAKKEHQEWQLTDVFMRRRRLTQQITFQQPFATPPHMLLGITSIEISKDNASIGITAQEIRQDGFLLVLETSSENRVRELQVSWLAHGQPSALPSHPKSP